MNFQNYLLIYSRDDNCGLSCRMQGCKTIIKESGLIYFLSITKGLVREMDIRPVRSGYLQDVSVKLSLNFLKCFVTKLCVSVPM